MKPQDIIVLLKLLIWEKRSWSQLELAQAIGISPSEVNHALKRLEKAKLYNRKRKEVLRRSAVEMLLFGLKYFFPAEIGRVCRGIPTAHSAKPLADELVYDSADIYVWPDAKGKAQGHSVVPLYPSVAQAVKNDPDLHSLLALCDALRVGRIREFNIARKKLEEYFEAA